MTDIMMMDIVDEPQQQTPTTKTTKVVVKKRRARWYPPRYSNAATLTTTGQGPWYDTPNILQGYAQRLKQLPLNQWPTLPQPIRRLCLSVPSRQLNCLWVGVLVQAMAEHYGLDEHRDVLVVLDDRDDDNRFLYFAHLVPVGTALNPGNLDLESCRFVLTKPTKNDKKLQTMTPYAYLLPKFSDSDLS